MAQAPGQLNCLRCHAPLEADAAYCFKCGERTQRARRQVRFFLRLELLLLALTVILVFGFAFVFYHQ